MNFPLWFAHGELGTWDEMVLAAVGLIALLYFGFIWRRDRADPFARLDEAPDSKPEDAESPPADRLD